LRFRRELQLHCYRIFGSLHDAEDLVQETLLAAWRGLSDFERRSSLRSWLYTIATNRCLNALRDSSRGPSVANVAAAGFGTGRSENFSEISWLEPYPDLLLEGIADEAPGPDARYEAKESVALAFVSGLQYLAPLQRAVLVLRDVLGFRAAEVAEMLGTSEPAVNSAFQRARGLLESRAVTASDARERLSVSGGGSEGDLIARFADAFLNDDIDGVVALLTEDAVVSMPPEPEWHQGREAIATFLRDRALHRFDNWRFVETGANRQPALAYYLRGADGAFIRHGLFVISVRGDEIESITRFHDDGLLSRFGVTDRVD
jgi:RNA polymerase sigma-70 factor (ECF subfamily)